MKNVTDRIRNPFGMRPDCPSFVPGYGDANADFHVVGDRPGVHGGTAAGVPFTGEAWSPAFLSALAEAGLIAGLAEGVAPDGVAREGDPTAIDPVRTDRTFLSYLHMCENEDPPDDEAYDDMERFFDAELRAIAAHVLLPVGARATQHVLETYTARARKTEIDMRALHGEELLGAGWLVVPISDPADWRDGDADRLVASLRELRSTDFRRESDLGRFVAGNDPYLVR
ncbi:MULTISPECIES: uracil-DNA glycosylase family protein [Halorubrum]|uniref:Uracil-DNA glycosylase n=1 Tax=Halorubrum sodomense TaxID=35743 RepID=A0A1I6G758_HALSD|nr:MULTISPECIES: uracil-DNA glycosylase family protein [Halorubrum]TKX53100.1 uracil-DNA glycosylase [Halorubrum sp. SP3]TKX68152.1 uracil-DNA glycosylase [Halorubrum sp. SP9]SFR38038.1 Uracil-DNA glycosylase [Halorubrum sodomense]